MYTRWGEGQSELYTHKGNFQKALKDAEKAIEINRKNATAYENRGRINIFLGNDLNKALSDFTKAIELNPNYASAYTSRSNVYLKMREPEKAIDDCTKAIKIAPNDDGAPYFNRGLAYANMGEMEKALGDYNMVIQIDPKNVEAYGKRGVINSELDKTQDAISDFEEFLRLDPSNKMAKLVRQGLKDLKSGKKIGSGSEKNKMLGTLIVGGVVGAVLVGLISSFNLLGFLIGAFFGIGIGPFWADLKEELIIWGGSLNATIKKMLSEDVAEKGFIKGYFFGIFIFTPLRFLVGVVMFLVWPGLKLYFKLVISPFIAIHQIVTTK